MKIKIFVLGGKIAGKIVGAFKFQKRKSKKDRVNDLLAKDAAYVFLKTVQIYSKNGEVHYLPISDVKSYCAEKGLKYLRIQEEKNELVCRPSFYGVTREKNVMVQGRELYIAEIEDATVTGASSIIIAGKKCLYDPYAYDYEERLDIKFTNIVYKEKNKVCLSTFCEKRAIDAAVCLVGFASYNYYHWSVEILSRLKYVDDIEEYRDLPLLVDDVVRTIPQYKQLLYLANVNNRDIIYLDPSENRVVKRLIYPSYNTWMPINVKRNDLIKVSDFAIDKSAIDNLRCYAGQHLKKSEQGKYIFITRKNAAASRLDNEAEIRELFSEYGFEIVDTAELALVDQVELFSSSSIIAGATGAALTNIVYCNPGTRFVCFIPEKYEFYMYSTIAKNLGMESIFVDCMVTQTAAYAAMELYKANYRECERLLSEYLGLNRINQES